MNLALMICSGDPQVVWNAFRLGNLMLEQMEEVTIFLNGPAVNYASLASPTYPLADLARLFTLSEGVLLA